MSRSDTKHVLRAYAVVASVMIAGGSATTAYAYLAVRNPVPPQSTEVPYSPYAQSPVEASTHPSSAEASKLTATRASAGAMYLDYPASGQRVGTITLKRLHASWPIFEGTGTKQLGRGVGHYSRSVLPGLNDNSVLAGHRETVFNRLGELRRGDTVVASTRAGIFTYRVREFKVVKRTDRTVIVHTRSALLTLVTCYPFNKIGTTDHSYVVVAALVETAPSSD